MTWRSFLHLDRRQDNALLVYWDDVVRRQPAQPVPPADLPADLAPLVRSIQATAAAARPKAYQDELLHSLLATYEETPAMNVTTTTAPPLSTPRAPARPAAPKLPVSWIRRNAMPALEIGLIILLVLASIAGIWLTTDRNDAPNVLVPPVATPTAEASPDVPMYRGNPAHTGVFPGPGLDGDPIELWMAQVSTSIHSAPAIVDGILYIGAGSDGVRALDALSGDVLWEFTTAAPVLASPAVVDGVLYVGSEDDTLYALDSADGTQLWALPSMRTSTHIVVSEGTLYTGTADEAVVALDPASGEELWRVPLNAKANRAPAVADGMVYIGGDDGIVRALAADTGETVWTAQTDGGGLLSGAAVSNGTVIWGTFEGASNSVYAFDAATGDELWRFSLDNNPGYLAVAVDAQTVYVPSVDSRVYALDLETGTQVWEFTTNGIVNASPALVGDTLYVAGNDGFVYALNAATGAESWRFAIDGAADYGPVVIGGAVYVGTSAGVVYAIGGSNQFTFQLAAVTDATPTAAAGVASPMASPEAASEIATFLWASEGGDTPIVSPGVVAIAPNGDLWVANGERAQFEIIAPDGTWRESWGQPGENEAQFNFKRANGDAFGAVAFAPDGSFYVADTGNQRIQHFSADRQFLHAWGGFGEGDGQFRSPIDVDVDSMGNVFVNDDYREDVQKFDADGSHIVTFGGTGSEPGQLDFQGFMAIDPHDNVWVADPSNQRIQQWDNDGQFLRAVTTSDWLGAPIAIAFDDQGRVLISDIDGAEVVAVDPSASEVIGRWGTRGTGPGQFLMPVNVMIGSDGTAYVVDLLQGRLQAFALRFPPLPETTPVATPVS